MTAHHLKDKKALITGGSRGIGAAIVRRFAAEGAHVAFTYSSSKDKADALAKEAAALGVKAMAIQADAADKAAMQGLIPQVVTVLGGLDILVNNAGIFDMAPLGETTDEAFERMYQVNVRAPFILAREASKFMGEGGRIINIGSVLGEMVNTPGLGAYAMSKFAVAGMSRAWARDLGPRKITVNAIQPGPVDTDMNPENSDYAGSMAHITALGRYGKPSEIAALAAFLASDDARLITGEQINADGGYGA